MNPDNNQNPTQVPNQPQQLSPEHHPISPVMSEEEKLQATNFPLKAMQPGERIIAHIKPHPIGLILPVVTALLIVVFLLGGAQLMISTLPELAPYKTGILLITGLLSLLDLMFLWITIMVYNGNQWIVTSDSITQMSQTGLFFKRTSQMSFENLEDVTFSQKGLLPSLVDFGALSAESAGNHSKFVFRYCPQPQKYATQIIEAHEQFMYKSENVHELSSTSVQ